MGIAEALLFLSHEEGHKLKIKHNAFEELTKISHALGPSQSHFCFFLMISKKEMKVSKERISNVPLILRGSNYSEQE